MLTKEKCYIFVKNSEYARKIGKIDENTHKIFVKSNRINEFVKDALNAKKHVICEKPVAMNLEELDEMI